MTVVIYYSVEIIDKCINNIKLGKGWDPDGLSAEHLVHVDPLIYLHLCNLFKAIALHGFFRNHFGLGTIIP